MWTAAELRHSRVRLGGTVWRAVEAQHQTSTRRLVDTAAEQVRLEELLEGTKPAYPSGAQRLDYLLASPFRYGNPHGSRFRPGGQRWGIFYAGETVHVALAELAYHRMRFFLASAGTPLPRQSATLTVFAVRYATAAGLDLSRLPFAEYQSRWTDPGSYAHTQKLGVTAVEAEIDALRYRSARTREAQYNVAIFAVQAFADDRPRTRQTWYLYLGDQEATAFRALAGTREHHAFARSDWAL